MKTIITISLCVCAVLQLNAQTVVKMKITEPQQEEFTAKSVLEDNLPINAKVRFGAIGYLVSGGQEPYDYTWLENNIVVSKGETVDFVLRKMNQYSVVISDENKCSVELPINTEDVSVEEIRSKVSIYPTVVTSRITVDCNIGEAEIKIFDVNGTEHQYEVVYGNKDLEVDLNPGMYFAKISTPIGSYVEKIIVK
ncbi:T9SS type A sorting domain-containing protein [Plebeiibacterium marinum]|uniref:T9SS type A sorting domain-containing protein n=1 Tax=Plebeiibacterium marinum TaxID=2992111 RepID=A0AAE3SKJ9_9BACT|nr:T9SS type A sorting domain-containing protein [Plebeiobacterium marinum]MCW3806588.1 T9SS type A sorting domain-containing protein [Plebeiobacterium marinum]